MVCIIYRIKETPLLTIGDSIASFLQQHDETTKGLCLMSMDQLKEWKNSLGGTIPKPKNLVSSRRRWNSVVGASRWSCLFLPQVLYSCRSRLRLISTTQLLYFTHYSYSLFVYGIEPLAVSTSTLMGLPLGATDPNTMIEGNSWNVPAIDISAYSPMSLLLIPHNYFCL
jgi:hypothetical protein